MKTIKDVLYQIVSLLLTSFHKKTEREKEVEKWFAAQGDKTLRLDYKLDKESIVFDIGGYMGNWSADIFCKYQSNIYIFEPVPSYTETISQKFSNNDKVKVFSFALSSDNGETDLIISSDGSSISNNNVSGDKIKIKLVDTLEFLKNEKIEHIDLMKINIEGAEYDLMDYFIDKKITSLISDIQIQFHDFVDNAESRRRKIQDALSQTHVLTYNYEFVWENWRKKE